MANNQDGRNPPCREGDAVRLREGPFAGLGGVVEKVLPRMQRLVVMVSAFGQSVPAEAPMANVERGHT